MISACIRKFIKNFFFVKISNFLTILRFYDLFLQLEFILYFSCRVKNVFLKTLIPSRAIKLPTALQGFHIDATLPSCPDPSASSNKVLSLGTVHSLSHILSYANLSSPHRTFTTNMTIQRKPTSFYQVVKDPKWRAAMQ
jgi:hypothetical protein